MGSSTEAHGRCHCGALTLRFESPSSPAALPLRACSCSFCRKHSARCTSDPRGRVRIEIHEPDQLVRYRFALRTADYLVCARCGVYLAAVIRVDGHMFATVNVNTFEEAADWQRAAEPISYDDEAEAVRIARRRSRWTPATIA